MPVGDEPLLAAESVGLIVSSGNREFEPHHCSALRLVAYGCPAAVSQRDGVHDRQPEAGSAVASGPSAVGPAEALEGVRQEIGREPGSGVADLDHQVRAGDQGRDHDLRSPGSEPQRVVDEVVDNLADAPRVDWGFPIITGSDVPESLREDAGEAIRLCPKLALRL